MLRLCIFLVMIYSSIAFGETTTVPPKKVEHLAAALGYQDFPKFIDIISIIRVESNFKPNAFNREESKINPNRKIKPSIGLMQVQGGSFDIETNMAQGVMRLREYYILCKKDKMCAVKSYNIGPSNYKKGKCSNSGKEYWAKYLKRKQEYKRYYKG